MIARMRSLASASAVPRRAMTFSSVTLRIFSDAASRRRRQLCLDEYAATRLWLMPKRFASSRYDGYSVTGPRSASTRISPMTSSVSS